MNPTADWSGRAVQGARAIVKTWLPQPCGECGKPVTEDQRWVVGHIKPRATHPELTWVVSNWRAEHRKCSDKSAQSVVIAKAKAEERAAVFSEISAAGTPPPLPVSLPEGPHDDLIQPALPGIVLPFPTGKPMEVRDDLAWADFLDRADEWPWLAEFTEVPEDASPPLYMSLPPDDAVCSYGWEECTHLDGEPGAIAWAEQEQKIRLRWWQRLAISRQLEHRADGTLCAREYIESAPRRAGKSVRMRCTGLWRMVFGWKLFGEV